MLATKVYIDPITGFCFLPFDEKPHYGQQYFDNYTERGRSAFGVALNSLRVGLVERYLQNTQPMVDIGVGDGAFIRARNGKTWGYDVNPVAVEMLVSHGVWKDVSTTEHVDAASFWDSLEHIENPAAIIAKVEKYCFVSIPIFRDSERLAKSKHYKPSEHCWYFTRHGLIAWFWSLGFICVEMNDMETQLGREDIGTFVFARR